MLRVKLIPGWMNNHMPSKVCDEIDISIPKLQHLSGICIETQIFFIQGT